MKIAVLILISLAVQCSFGQDSLKIMYQNVLNFPGTTPDRADSLRNIISYVQPDVYVICELETAAGADLILNNAFNVYGKTNYQRANFEDGPYTDNMLFYNTDKLGLVSQLQLGTVLRDISVYKMYYKAPNLSAISDTIYFYFFGCHLKAGSADYQQRNLEIQQAKYYLNSIENKVENVFIGGDMNVYSAYESAVLTLKNTGSVPLFDPINVEGNWSGNGSFADYHTQSTRYGAGYGGGTGGGMDDRFDMILVSADVLNNDNGVYYIPNSYKALGQDGNRFNQEINSPTNFSIPDSVANALHRVSDHLPVLMTVALDETASLRPTQDFSFEFVYNPQLKQLELQKNGSYQLRIYDIKGAELAYFEGSDKVISLDGYASGVYLVKARVNSKFYTHKIIITP